MQNVRMDKTELEILTGAKEPSVVVYSGISF
jgi:hypothetical protein